MPIDRQTVLAERPIAPRIIRLPELLRLVGMSRSTIWRQQKSGAFPRSVPLSDRATGWHLDEVVEWMNAPREWANKQREPYSSLQSVITSHSSQFDTLDNRQKKTPC